MIEHDDDDRGGGCGSELIISLRALPLGHDDDDRGSGPGSNPGSSKKMISLLTAHPGGIRTRASDLI